MSRIEAIIVVTAGISLALIIIEQLIYTALVIRDRKKKRKEHE